MRCWCPAVVAMAFSSIAFGCSDDDPPAARCEVASDCTEWRCLCGDGSTPMVQTCFDGRCLDGRLLCDGICGDRGVMSVGETPNVNDSPECAAVCARADALACGEQRPCDRYHYCRLDVGECAAEKRAYLRCLAEQGSFECNALGGVTSSSTGCPSPRCSGDAG